MKNTYIIVAYFIFAAGAFAETRFPRGSFEAADLEKAKALATTQKKEISFIYTDKKIDCSLCQNAAAAYISAVKSKTVIVYVNSTSNKESLSKLPEFVQQAFMAGKYIPKLVVTDSAVSKVCASLTYEAYKEDDSKSIHSLRKALTAK
jgi:hypothetical protein